MTRATTGRSFLSSTSEALSRLFLGTPPGWTLSGYLGLMAMVLPIVSLLAYALDLVTGEVDHCYKAVLRSITRAGE